jgi:hypothetical protein
VTDSIRGETALVVVEWLDAWASGKYGTFPELAENHGPLRMLTVGWVVRQDADGITLCSERAMCRDKDGPISLGRDSVFIPAGMLQSVTPLAEVQT